MRLDKKNHAETGINTSTHDVQPELNDKSPVQWNEQPTLTLDGRGMIRDCNKAGEKAFGYFRRDLVWQHVSKLLPKLAEIPLTKNGQLNPHLDFTCHCGHLFQVQDQQGNTFPSELSFVDLGYEEELMLRLIIRPSDKAET